MQTDEQLIEQILQSRKYASVDEKLVRRVAAEQSARYAKEKDRLKAAKNCLHQIHGAYADCGMKELLQLASLDAMPGREREFLIRHASTRERLPVARELYAYIFSAFGGAQSVLDLGCGLNPLFLPLMGEKIARYCALDVDTDAARLLNLYFAQKGLPQDAGVEDLIQKTPETEADLAFLMKLLPVLEQQKKGRSRELLLQLRTDAAAVSFPLRSLGGRSKGMEQNYSAFFEGILDGTGFTVLDRCVFAGELVYLIKRG